MSNPKCKCDFSKSITGDGCRYCQPQEYIDRLTADFKDIDSENDSLRDLLEWINNSLIYSERSSVTNEIKNRINKILNP